MPRPAGEALGTAAALRLAELGVTLRPGLTGWEIAAVEARFAFEFADDHRAFLATSLPAGPGWPDWRDGEPSRLRAWLDRPVEGVLFDVEYNGFWHERWGPRPSGDDEAVAVATARLATVPRMVPVYSHRYLPAGRGTHGGPVLSIVQTDAVCYGADLADFVEHEFAGRAPAAPRTAVPFWSELVD